MRRLDSGQCNLAAVTMLSLTAVGVLLQKISDAVRGTSLETPSVLHDVYTYVYPTVVLFLLSTIWF